MSQIQITKPEIESENNEFYDELNDDELNDEEFIGVDNEIQVETERNEEIHKLSIDMGVLYGIFQECSNLIFGQAQELDEVEDNLEKSLLSVQDGTEHLEKAAQYQTHSRGKVFDICMLVGGVGIGALGWIGGPWIGIPTMAAGLGLTGGIVVARNKLESL
jgi:t-SNARE complex subunit (syntaxin)